MGKSVEKGNGILMKIHNKISNVRFWTGCIITAMIAAAAVFAVMLQIEKNMLSGYEKGEIYIAVADIPKGQVLTEENMDKYVALQNVDIQLIPDTAISDCGILKGLSAKCGIEKGVLLTRGMFVSADEAAEGIDEPVIAGIKADDVYQFVGGVLRAGDHIHIYNTDESGNVRLKWSSIYVQQVFDGSGKSIKNDDTDTAAQRINIYIDKSDVENFYTELKTGSLRVVKVCE